MEILNNQACSIQNTNQGSQENQQTADYLILIQMIFKGALGNLQLEQSNGQWIATPQSAFLITTLANVLTSSSFLSDLQNGSTPLDQELYSLLNQTPPTGGDSLLQLLQGAASGNMSCITALIADASSNSSPLYAFLQDINGAGLNYSLDNPSGGTSPNYSPDLQLIEGIYGILPLAGLLKDALNNGEFTLAQQTGGTIAAMLNNLLADAQSCPNDPMSQFVVALIDQTPIFNGESLIAFLNNGIAGGNGSLFDLETLNDMLNGIPDGASQFFSFANIIKDLCAMLQGELF